MTDKDKDRQASEAIDPMFVDKGERDMAQLMEQGDLFVANPDDSRINLLESESFEDNQQVFTATPQSEESGKCKRVTEA